MAKRPYRPRDIAQRARFIIEIATGERPNDSPKEPESARAKVGRLGGLKGGKARAAKLGPRKRKAIAKKAARARWR